jgi:hypothetical protein
VRILRRILPRGEDVPPEAYAFIVAVAAVAAGVLLVAPWGHPNAVAFVVLAVSCLVFQRFMQVRFGEIHLSPISVFGLTAGILLPPAPAGVVAAIGVLSARRGVSFRDPTMRLKNFLYNASQWALATVAGAETYRLFGGVTEVQTESFPPLLGQVLAAALAFGVTNALLLATAVRLMTGEYTIRSWRRFVGSALVGSFATAMIALLIAVLWSASYGPLALFLIPVPIYTAWWGLDQYAKERAAYEATIRTLVQAVEIKDHYTRGHSERVARASELIAQRIGMRPERIRVLRYAGILHDVGKLGVPTRLLRKSGPLEPDEYAAIQQHPARGVDIVGDISFLGEAYEGILHHHERLDGRGYPAGLAGDAIPEFARIIGVADAFDSMTSTRSYRGARPVDEAVSELERCAGTQFDPAMVRALTESLEIAAAAGEPWRTVDASSVPADSAELAAVARVDHDDPSFADTIGTNQGARVSGGGEVPEEDAADVRGSALTVPQTDRGGWP